MAGKNFSEAMKKCEEELAGYVNERYAMLEGYFKDKKMAEYEERAKKSRAVFEAQRGSAANRAESDMNEFEASFVKWYEGNEDIDDAPLFTHAISLFRETKERLAVYSAAIGTLSSAGKSAKPKEACIEALSRAFEPYKAAAQKYDSLAQKLAQKEDNERMTDDSSTLLRYIDLNHEMRKTEMMVPAPKDSALQKTLSRTGNEYSTAMMLRAHAYHAKNRALQEIAKEMLLALYAYQGALCAAYLVSDAGLG